MHGHNDKACHEEDKGDYNAVAAHFIVRDISTLAWVVQQLPNQALQYIR